MVYNLSRFWVWYSGTEINVLIKPARYCRLDDASVTEYKQIVILQNFNK